MNLMSKFGVQLLIILFAVTSAQAQFRIKKHDERNRNRGYSYGIHLALNQHNFRIDHSEPFLNQTDLLAIEGNDDLGLEVGLIGSLHFSDHVEARALPGITFGNRSVSYMFATEAEPVLQDIPSTFFDLPIQLKYKSDPYNDWRMYIIGGGRFRANLSTEAASDNPATDDLRFTPSDLAFEFGAGAEFHFDLFTFSPELKITQGIQNQREQNDASPFSNNLSGLYSRIYTISFNIE